MAKGRSGKKSAAKTGGQRAQKGPKKASDIEPRASDRRESGEPGGGQGRRDEVGRSGVYPLSAENIPPGAEIRWGGQWGGGDYNEAGGSELVYRDGVLLGGMTAGPDGEPTIDIHSGRAPEAPRPQAANEGDEQVDHETLMMRGLPRPRDDDERVDR